MFQLAPSLLAADFWNLEASVLPVVQAGAKVLHLDVMDGHFVPNLTMGPCVVSSLKGKTNAILDVHLMVERPDDFIDAFAAAGADWISYHIEAGYHAHRTCQKIKGLGLKAGIAINPATPIFALESIIESIDFVLLMSVNPGFGGQSFIPQSYLRLQRLMELIGKLERKPFVQIDGGVGEGNLADLVAAGVEVAVAGSSVFQAADPVAAVKRLLELGGAV